MGDLRVPLAAALDAYGVPASVTRPAPDDTPIITTVIWVATPLQEGQPVGSDWRIRDPRRVMGIPRVDVPTYVRGTTVVAPEAEGGNNKTWRVDGLERTEADLWRVIVALAT